MYYLVGKARPQRTLPRSLHLPPPMWFSSGSSHRPNPLPPLPVDQAFASSQGRRPQQQPHPLGPLCLATFNIGLTLNVTGSAQKDTKEPKLRKDLKALAKALNHCEKFKTTCIVVTQHVCPRPPPGPLSLNEWFHVPGTIHQVAHIICLQEVSDQWFRVARTSVPHGWSGWWHDRLGIRLEPADGPLSGDAEDPQGIPKHNGGEEVVSVLRPGGVCTQTMNDRTMYEDTYLCFVHVCVQVCARRSCSTSTVARTS